MRRNCLKFARDESGATFLLFALALMPVMLMLGAAVDYSRSTVARSALNSAADAAALTAVRQAAQAYAAGQSSWQTIGVQAGQSMFTANAATVTGVSVSTPSINISQSGAALTATLTYTGQVPTHFMSLAHVNSVTVGATVSASYTLPYYTALPTYTDIHIVIDVSQSMGIGATAADQQTMYNAIGCTLACHYTDIYGDVDNLAAARKSGATLRIDAVKSAIVSALTQASTAAPNSTQVRVAVYTMSNSLTTVHSLSTGISAAINAINGIDLSNTVNQGGTNISYSLQQLNSLLATPGNGKSAGSPQGVVMLITDGVQDSTIELYNNGKSSPFYVIQDPHFVVYAPDETFTQFAGNPIEQGLDYSKCAPIKTKGYTMITLDVQYVVPTVGLSVDDQARYGFISNSLLPYMSANMTSCATSGAYAYSANSPTQIAAALISMFTSKTSASGGSVHLTQ